MSAGRAILVTGATGLIGAEVVARLSSRHSVIAVTHRQPQRNAHGWLDRALGRVRAVVVRSWRRSPSGRRA